MKLKIMTYNIAGGSYYGIDSDIDSNGAAPRKLTHCAQVIKDISPDICGLNEVNRFELDEEEADQTAFLKKFTGLGHGYFGKTNSFSFPVQRDYGNAVISKHPVLSSEIIMIPDPERKDENAYYETRNVTKVKLDVAGGITVLQTHFGLAVAEKQNAMTTLCDIIDNTEGPIVLMGDFNIRPTDFLLNPIRERLFDTAFIRENEYLKTFPSYKTKHPDCKIDYIFVSKHFKTLSVDVPQLQVSDHYPYLIEVEI